MYNVEFKNQTAADFHLLPIDIGRRQIAEEEMEQIPIPYRHGMLTIRSGAYKSYEREMTFLSTEAVEFSQLSSWLNGSGKLRTALDEGGYFEAEVIGQIQVLPDLRGMVQLRVTFLIQPFFFLDDGERLITLTGAEEIYNPGTMAALPIITVYGSGDIQVNIGSQFVNLKGVVGSLTMNTPLKLAYAGVEPAGRKMIGEYLEMPPGINNVAFTGNVSKLEIEPRWWER